MRSLGPQAGLAGALDVSRTETGIVPRRLPQTSLITDPFFNALVQMPAGVRVVLETDTTELELDVMVTRYQIDDSPERMAVFDLVVDGTVMDSRSVSGAVVVVNTTTWSFQRISGGPETVRFEGLPGRAGARVEVWLPHNALVELRDVRTSDNATAGPPPLQRVWAHYGSSISHCMEAEQPTGMWPAVAALRAGVDLQDLAFAGQCLLDPFVARVIRDLDADVISLKVGINVVNHDAMRERVFVPALHGFLDTIREGCPTTPIALVTPIHCPCAEDRPGPTVKAPNGRFVALDRPANFGEGALTVAKIRDLIGSVVAIRGDPNLHLMSGLDLLGADDAGDLPDDLHPNPAGYRRIGERFFTLAFAPGRPLATVGAGSMNG